jgi:leader peptidase (prepilin peptidase)/N-methyltransferase
VTADVPGLAVALWVALVGGAIGSFLNVVIARVPAGESVVSPGSRCPRCRRAIAWYDNVPVVSWLVLRGRCRGCRAPISPRYPLVELLGAGAALAAWARHGLSGGAAAELLLVAVLVALAFIDLDTWLLPHVLTWPLIPLGLAAAALGFGDVWLLSGIGAWLGVQALLPVILLASIQGAIVGVALLALGRAEKGPEAGGAAQPDGWVPPRNAVPFGPFLVLASLEWLYGARAIAAVVPALEAFL